MSNAFNNAAKLLQVFNVKEPRFGAKGDNSTNDTAALQAAIDAAEAVNGTVFVPAGIYRNSGLTITEAITLRGEGQLVSELRMIGASNTHCITVAVGVDQGLTIEALMLNGVSSANSSGHGIHFPVDAVSAYGQTATLRDVYITDCAGDGIRVDGNRNNGQAHNVFIARCDNGMRFDDASDWRVFGGGLYQPDAHCLLVVSGADNVFTGTAFYEATAAAAVKLDGDSSSPTKLLGCTINANQMNGLEIAGPSGIARHIAHVIAGCWFESNGLATNDTYADIKLTDVSGVIMSGNSFRNPGSVNLPKYTVEFAGTTGDQEWTGNSIATSPPPYVTALTNTAFRLYTRTQGLKVDADIRFGTHSASADTAVTGYITIVDAGGTTRRLAVVS